MGVFQTGNSEIIKDKHDIKLKYEEYEIYSLMD